MKDKILHEITNAHTFPFSEVSEVYDIVKSYDKTIDILAIASSFDLSATYLAISIRKSYL